MCSLDFIVILAIGLILCLVGFFWRASASLVSWTRRTQGMRADALDPGAGTSLQRSDVLTERIQQLNTRTRICTREEWEEAYLPDILGANWSSRVSLECSICLGQIAPTARVRGLGCGHMFHLKCLADWFLRDSTLELRCPLCRMRLAEQPCIRLEGLRGSDHSLLGS